MLATLLLLPALPVAAQSVADHVALGVAAMQVHDLHTSLAHYEAALVLDSTAYEANWRAALALLDEGEQIPDSVKSPERDSLYARAEVLARRAVAADSNRAEGHFALAAAVGRASLTMGKKARIRRFFAKNLLGAGIFNEASWEEAVSDMERAVALDPGRLYHRLELAEIYVDRKRYDDARSELAQLAALPDREIMDSVYRRQAEALAARIAKKK